MTSPPNPWASQGESKTEKRYSEVTIRKNEAGQVLSPFFFRLLEISDWAANPQPRPLHRASRPRYRPHQSRRRELAMVARDGPRPQTGVPLSPCRARFPARKP